MVARSLPRDHASKACRAAMARPRRASSCRPDRCGLHSPSMRWIADLLYVLAGLAYLPIAIYNAVVLGKNRRGWRERFGFVRTFDRAKPRIWIHAVSLGEVNATPRLVEQLEQRLPDHEIVVSTTTDTGFARAVHFYGRDRVFRFPLDFSTVISRVLKRVNPTMIVLVELEVWFNHVRMAAARGIPVAVVNGRLTERSARRLAWLGALGRSMFTRLAWVGAQEEAIADRLIRLGTPRDRVEVTSSLKWDSAVVGDEVEGAPQLARAMQFDSSRPLWVCGSTGPGEEAMILDAYRQLLEGTGAVARGVHEVSGKDKGTVAPILAIVPRKPERFDEVARLVQRAGFSCVRRTECPDGPDAAPVPDSAVRLGDTMGELRKFYSLADVVFVGRSLVAMGGSDPMEVAALGKPIVVGPHTDNFQLPIRALDAADAVTVVASPSALADAVSGLLADATAATDLGSRAKQVVLQNQGATVRTCDSLVRLL